MLLLIPGLPFLGFLINAFVGRRLSRGVSGAIASGVMLAAFAVSIGVVMQMLGQPADPGSGGLRAIEQRVFTWIASADLFVPFSLRVDPLSALMILVVTGIGSLIHIYSTAYMHDEPPGEYARYFSYLNLFASFMLILVLGASFPVMFVGWEGVGLCSYLLIGFWFRKKSASDAGKKAFIVNRIGDFGFILGMLLIFVTFNTLNFQEVNSLAAAWPREHGFGVLTIATLLLFVGATGKSAQIPLYTWLPDAMEGPTPVSALIHAATMVTAGVYMIGRNAVLFGQAEITMQVVAVIGIATALMAGTIALVQNDIKRVLAYSTVSQLGYMFVAMGAGAFAAGIFHLYTHAFFKALLFLGSGAVIHALAGEQDIRNMGGLKKKLPITYWTFLIGTLAIAGVPLLSGFFSKDEILWKTYSGGHYGIWIVGMITSLLTAVYMFRLVFLTFHGESRNEGAHHGEPHDAPRAMAIPLIVLAIGSILAGYLGIPHALGGHNWIHGFLDPSFTLGAVHEAEAHADTSMELMLMVLSSLVAFAGIGIAAFLFLKGRPRHAEAPGAQAGIPARSAKAGALHTLLLNKYYVDELYDAVIVRPVHAVSSAVLWKGVDVRLIDGAVNGTGLLVRASSSTLRRVQTGSVRAYAMATFAGVIAMLGYYLWRS
ncbi:MAG: NADH-quinone oxidoreductase subunit L [Vicinamibacterales bacterium]